MADQAAPFDAAGIPSFTVTRFRVSLLFEDPIAWSPLSGIILRGAIGERLERANQDAYNALFKPPSGTPAPLLVQPVAAVDTPDLDSVLGALDPAAGPFSFHDLHHHIYLHYRRRVAFDVVLLGAASRLHAEFLLAQVWELQHDGLGRYSYQERGRTPFQVVGIAHIGADGVHTIIVRESENGEATRLWQSPTNGLPPSFTPDDAVRRASVLARGSHLDIAVTSPMHLRAKIQGGKQVSIKRPTYSDLIDKSWNRLSTLNRHYGDDEEAGGARLAQPDRYALESARGRWLHHHWADHKASSRSFSGQRRVQGAVGTYCTPNYVRAALPLLAYIEQVGVGQMTVRGMGRIHVSPVNMP